MFAVYEHLHVHMSLCLCLAQMRMNANASVCVPLYTHVHLCAFFISRFFMHAHQVYIARQRSLEAVSCTTIKRIHEVCVCVCVVCVCVRAACACPSASVHVCLTVCQLKYSFVYSL